MANLKEIRSRITSVSSTMQITSAMKMVSAAKLKRAQDAITQMRPYANKLSELLQNLSSNLDSSDSSIYSKQREVNNVLIVAITSNRGLCGGFNANIIKKTKLIIEESYPKAKTSIISIGKKSSEHFKKNGYEVISTHDDLYNEISFSAVSKIAEEIMTVFVNGEYDRVYLVYNQFKNAATQNVMQESFLPVQNENDKTTQKTDYIFEPSQTKIVNSLIPKSLKTQLFKAILDSHASEHGARMTASIKRQIMRQS